MMTKPLLANRLLNILLSTPVAVALPGVVAGRAMSGGGAMMSPVVFSAGAAPACFTLRLTLLKPLSQLKRPNFTRAA